MVTCRRCLTRRRTRKYIMLGRCGMFKAFTVAAIVFCYVIVAYVTIKLNTSFARVFQNANNTRQSENLVSWFIKDSASKCVGKKSNTTLLPNRTQMLETRSFQQSFTGRLKSATVSPIIPRADIVHGKDEHVISQDKSCCYSGLHKFVKRSTLSDKLILNSTKDVDIADHIQYQESDNNFSKYQQEMKEEMIKMKYEDEVNKLSKKSTEHPQCNRFVTISAAMGRTGNQLFQVAAVIGTAHRYNLIPVLSENFPLLRHFNLRIKTIKQALNNTVTFAAEKPGVYKEDIEYLNITSNLTLDGFFQSWKYFSEAAGIVRDIIQLKTNYLNEPRAFLKSVYKPGRVNVCVHVRRGDMLRQTAKNDGYKIADKSFFPKAMDCYRNRFKGVLFIIISDGMFWCKQHLVGDDIVYSPFYDSATDMALMTSCDHVIVTSGTFGWWGAWLTRGLTVYYSGYPANGTKLDRSLNRQDYYPKEWIGII